MTEKIGLRNIGNTCFMNAVIQALRKTPPLIHLLFNTQIKIRDESKKTKLFLSFRKLLYDMISCSTDETKHYVIAPSVFIRDMFITMYDADDAWMRPGEQSDSAEMLQYLLDSFHDATYYNMNMYIYPKAEIALAASSELKSLEAWLKYHNKEYSQFVELFTGQSQNKFICTVCNNSSEVYEPWLMLKPSIPMLSSVSFTDCMNETFKSELMENYQCDKCKTRTIARIESSITKTPLITIVAFKRFTNTGTKIRGKINWDLNEIDMRPWMTFKHSPFTSKQVMPIYETYAVIEHNGALGHGHYHMFAKEYISDDREVWINYDDDSVTPVIPERVVSPDSYIIFLISKGSNAYEQYRMKQIINVLRLSRGKDE